MANIFSASFAHNFTGLPHSYTNSSTTCLGFSVRCNMIQIANGLRKSDLLGQNLAVKSLNAVRIPFKSARLLGNASAAAVTEKSIHDFTVKDIDGKDVPLSKFKGKVLLAVNVASRCGLTPSNYSELSHLYEKYKTQGTFDLQVHERRAEWFGALIGFEILAFPCNQFGGQEPGTNPQIKEFACTRFKAEFPIFDKVDVNGPNTAPVYQFLKSSKGGGLFGDGIKWNFEKFLIDRDGKVVERYAPTTSPLQIEKDIQKLLAA